jgi:hypothetical protein
MRRTDQIVTGSLAKLDDQGLELAGFTDRAGLMRPLIGEVAG